MMQATVIVLTVLGCGDQVRSCDLLLGQDAIYHSYTECQTAIPAALQNSKNAPYPVITARCDEKGGTESSVQSSATKFVTPPSTIDIDDANHRAPVSTNNTRLSVAGAMLHRARGRYVLLQESASKTFATMSNVAAVSYIDIHRGVRSSISGTERIAKRTVATIQGNIDFMGQ